MIRPAAKTLFHTIAATTASVAILLAVVLWRLSNGPISLAFLAPYVEQALSAEDASYRVNFEDFILTWAGWDRTLDVRALRVQSFSVDGTLLATIPEMAVELSIAAMLRGIVAPTKLEFFNTDLSLTIGADGILSPDFHDSSADSLKLYFADMIGRALDVPHTEHPLSYLRSVKIVESNITFHQPDLEPIWAATAVNVEIEHSNSGIKLKLDAGINLDGSLVDLAISAQLDSTSRLINADIQFSSLKPKLLLGIAPITRHIQGIDIALNGRTSIVASTALDIKKIAFEFNGGPGELSFQELFPQTPSLIVSNLRAAGILKPITQTLTLDEIFIDLGNTTINASASVEGEWLKPKIEANILVENLPVSRIGEAWPPTLATNAREWVTSRISHGTVERLDVHLNIDPGDWENSRIANRETIYGQFSVVGSTVDYLPGLPVAEDLTATGWYDGVDLHFNISDGHLSNQTLRDVTVSLSGLEKSDARGTIRIKSVGPINDLVQILNTSPVQNAHVLFTDLSLLKGTIDMDLEVNFPLLKDLEIEELQISGVTVLNNVSIQNLNPSPLLPKIDIKDLNGKMIIRTNGFDLDGTTLANETPIKFSWQENLTPQENQFVTRIDLHTRLGESERKQWAINDNRLQGFIGATVTLMTDTDGTTETNISIDATAAHLTIPSLQWSKIPGTSAKAEIALNLKNGIPLGNPTFDFSSENFVTRGHIELSDQQFVKSLVFKLLEVGETRLSGRLDVEENGKYNIEIAADALDIRPFIGNSHIDDMQQIIVSGTAATAILTDKVILSGIEGSMTRHKDGSITLEGMAHELDLRSYFADKSDNHETVADEEQKFPQITFSGNIKRVVISDLMHLSDLHGEIHYDGDKIGLAEINAHLEESDNVEFRISERHKSRVLSITSENAGAVLRALDVTDDVVGGSLNLQGTFHDDQEGKPLTGELIINDFHVVNAPPLAKLLTIATLTGALELLGGKGLPFDQLQAPFVYQDETIIFDKARASGLSLGLTINGGIRLRDNIVDLNGTIIPAYILNSFVSYVPVIGDILIGGDGQGVFAATYRARGSFDDMEITVNPLTLLAPGILRDLFKLFDRAANPPSEDR